MSPQARQRRLATAFLDGRLPPSWTSFKSRIHHFPAGTDSWISIHPRSARFRSMARRRRRLSMTISPIAASRSTVLGKGWFSSITRRTAPPLRTKPYPCPLLFECTLEEGFLLPGKRPQPNGVSARLGSRQGGGCSRRRLPGDAAFGCEFDFGNRDPFWIAGRLPQSEVVRIRDQMAATPAQADNMVSAIKSLYKWACDDGIYGINPAEGVAKIDKGKGGAIPLTPEDLKTYRKFHAPGTPAHLCLTLFMFTACRISDAVLLGRGHEFMRNGVPWLGWQPTKLGSAFVRIPILPPLYKATRAAKVQGPTYLLTEYGRPFKSPEGLRNRFRKWCDAAGLNHLSSHGIRKGAGQLLAEMGCTQYQIMAVQGHTRAKTSEVYTESVNRADLAADAMRVLEAIDW